MYDVTIIGSGAAGMMSAITSAKRGKSVLLLEKMPQIGRKLKATGGGKCNLTNRLEKDEFIDSFGKNGRFMRNAIYEFDNTALLKFFFNIGLKTETLDGFRVFPSSRDSQSVLDALEMELKRVKVEVICNQFVKEVTKTDNLFSIKTQNRVFKAKNLIIATGGLGFSSLGTSGDGYRFAKAFNHSIKETYPAMLPLHVEQSWVKNCRADTIANATLRVNLPKMKKLQKTGDLIFTKNGIRGPVVLDFSTQITPLLDRFGKVPLLVNLTKITNEEEIKEFLQQNPQTPIVKTIQKLLPTSLSVEFCKMLSIDEEKPYIQLSKKNIVELAKILAWTPLSITGHDGFEKAMITKGGVNLKEIDPKTMQSRLVKNLYFCGEVLDIDGPCGGFNLQWSFSSGYLAGCLKD